MYIDVYIYIYSLKYILTQIYVYIYIYMYICIYIIYTYIYIYIYKATEPYLQTSSREHLRDHQPPCGAPQVGALPRYRGRAAAREYAHKRSS